MASASASDASSGSGRSARPNRTCTIRWTWAFVNAAVGLLLFSSLTTTFYLRHAGEAIEPATESHFRYLEGTFHYPLIQDQDPFILTNPLWYCHFQDNMKVMDEAVLSKWFQRYAGLCKQRNEAGVSVRPAVK